MTPAQLGIHGTASMYLKCKCDCEACSQAAQRSIPHGTKTGRYKWRCKCQKCKSSVVAPNSSQSVRAGEGRAKVTKWVPKEQPDAYGVDTSDVETEFAAIEALPYLDQWSHGDYRRAKAGCRCPLCEAGKARFYAEYLRDMRPEDHGKTLTAYIAGCRCKKCKDHERLYRATAAIKTQRAAAHK